MAKIVVRFELNVPDDCADYVRGHLQQHGMPDDVTVPLADGIFDWCIAYAVGADADALTDWSAPDSTNYVGMEDSED